MWRVIELFKLSMFQYPVTSLGVIVDSICENGIPALKADRLGEKIFVLLLHVFLPLSRVGERHIALLTFSNDRFPTVLSMNNIDMLLYSSSEEYKI